MSIQHLPDGDAAAAARWDDYVRAHPRSTFFHLSAWKGLIGRNFGHDTFFLQVIREGRITGVLPLARVRSFLFGHTLVGLPFAVYGGVVADTEADARALEDAAGQLAQSLGADLLELRNTERRHEDWPTQELYVTFKQAIPAVLDDRMLAIPQKRRNMVRKAIKLGLKPVVGDSVDRFFPVFAENSRDHGTPAMPRRYFEALAATFPNETEIISVNDAQDRCISSILCFYFKGEVMAYYAGETPAAKAMAANDLKYWTVMKRAQERGCAVFDLGRSKRNTGSFEFKRLWGFEMQPLYYQYRLYKRDTVPQNNPSNPKYRLMIAAWQRLPLAVANFIGPHLVRSLG